MYLDPQVNLLRGKTDVITTEWQEIITDDLFPTFYTNKTVRAFSFFCDKDTKIKINNDAFEVDVVAGKDYSLGYNDIDVISFKVKDLETRIHWWGTI